VKNAAIVGCGNIAGFLDSPEQSNALTHAHAYKLHSLTKLIAVCDPSEEQRKRFVQKWGQQIKHYASVKEMLENETIEVLSICSPTIFHYEAMLEALMHKDIKTIICEKPFVQTQNELDTLQTLMKSSNKRIIINFMRRYDPNIQKLSNIISNETLGTILNFTGSFTKGLYHNGSHMLELIEHLCGNISAIQSPNFINFDGDFYGSFFVKTSDTQGVIQNFSGDNYALFELEIVFSKGRIIIKDSGHTIHIETATPSKQYKGYHSLKQTENFDDTMNMNLLNTLEFSLSASNTDEILSQHLKLSQKLLDIKSNGPENLQWGHS